MTGEELAQRLRNGRRVYGTLIVSPSPHWPSAVKGTGVDFVFIDTEHIAIDRVTLAWMCQTYRALHLPPVVRIPSPDPYEACKVLDGGAIGVLAPYIESPEQVRVLVGAVKKRPLKGDYLTRTLDGDPLPPELHEYIEARNANHVLLINIESAPAIARLDEILAVEGVDGVQLGPHDLSCSLGVPEQYDHPVFLDAVSDIIQRCRAHSLGVGVHFWAGIEQELMWAQQGANLIMHSGDITLFTQTLAADLRRFRAALGEGETVAAETVVI